MSLGAATSWLTFWYVTHALAMILGAFALGRLSGLVQAPGAGPRQQALPGWLRLSLGVAAGAGLLSTAVAFEAVVRGRFRGWLVGSMPWWAGLLLAAAFVMLFLDWRRSRSDGQAGESGGAGSRACSRGSLPVLEWTLVGACVLAGVNVSLNALAPDCQMDSLWYHLSLARSWVEWDHFGAYAAVFPSNYSLLHSVLYAVALVCGDEIHCSLIYGLCGFVCFVVAAGYAGLWFGLRAGLWTWYLCATAFAAHVWFAPVHAGADLPVAMFSTAGMLTALHVVSHGMRGDRPGLTGREARRLWLLSGFLLGCALATKITTLGYFIVPWLGLCGWAFWKRPDLRRAMPGALALTVLPFVPWALRSGFHGCGNPLYPLAREWLPVREGWEVLLRSPGHLSIFHPSLSGLAQALQMFPEKIHYMSHTRSPGFIIHAAVIAGLLARRPVVRATGAVVLLQWAAQFWTTGFNELARYFAQCFPMVFPVAGWALVRFGEWERVSRAVRALSLAAFAVLVGLPYVQRQIECGAHGKVPWPYRPILTVEDKRAYLSGRECDLVNYPLYEWINAHTPRDAVILMGNIGFPFYIERRYLWADPGLDYFTYLEQYGGVDTPAKARRWLADNGVDYVVAYADNVFHMTVWAGATTVTATSVEAPAALLRPLPPEAGE
jgi:hypothetical protein